MGSRAGPALGGPVLTVAVLLLAISAASRAEYVPTRSSGVFPPLPRGTATPRPMNATPPMTAIPGYGIFVTQTADGDTDDTDTDTHGLKPEMDLPVEQTGDASTDEPGTGNDERDLP